MAWAIGGGEGGGGEGGEGGGGGEDGLRGSSGSGKGGDSSEAFSAACLLPSDSSEALPGSPSLQADGPSKGVSKLPGAAAPRSRRSRAWHGCRADGPGDPLLTAAAGAAGAAGAAAAAGGWAGRAGRAGALCRA